MSLGHNAYELKRLSFELSLSVLGFSQFLERYSSRDSEIYKYYESDYFSLVKVKLLELAIHQRSLDDDYKELLKNGSFGFDYDSEIMDREYKSQPFCFDCTLKKPIDSLRESSNKIIHTVGFQALHSYEIGCDDLYKYLGLESQEKIFILNGDKYGKPWTIALDVVKYCEQTYLFAEILSEMYGI